MKKDLIVLLTNILKDCNRTDAPAALQSIRRQVEAFSDNFYLEDVPADDDETEEN